MWSPSSTGPPDGTPPAGCDRAIMGGWVPALAPIERAEKPIRAVIRENLPLYPEGWFELID